jgi:hypothetical protein
MILKGKGFEFIINFFINQNFDHIWLKNAFDFGNYGFWKYAFNIKMFMFMWYRAWMHNTHDIKSICSQNVFISKM